MHYTGLNSAARSIAVLSDPICEVSSHYLVDTDGRILQMVREADRAWHAGQSYWQGETDINSCSIGIEIQNPGHAAGSPDFPDAQMEAVERLSIDIIERHGLRPEHILAHSDIAPQRKSDPGEKFDWHRLWSAGIGHWVAPVPVEPEADRDAGRPAPKEQVRRCQDLLAAYGYQVAQHGLLDAETARVISAFQRHFRPERVDGWPDRSTIETLQLLIDALGGEPTNPASSV